jgi:hypothetical protein
MQRIRKPLLYPLSYEGASTQATCQRVRIGARVYGPVQASWQATREHTGSTRAPSAGRAGSGCGPVRMGVILLDRVR